MRELHVVAVSEDGRHLVLGPAPTEQDAPSGARGGPGTHRLPIDTRLAAALRGELSQRPGRAGAQTHGRAAAHEPPLTVREMQARLRTGESVEQIAASAKVPVEHVRRFAGPVLSEREKIIERARATPIEHGRRGQSALPLGEVLDLQFAAMQGVRPDTVAWSTRREESGTWLVEVTYTSRARARTGAWRYDPKARTLVAADTVSAALGHSDNLEGTAAALPVGSLAPGSGRARPSSTRPAKAGAATAGAGKAGAGKAGAGKAGPGKAGAGKAGAGKAGAAKEGVRMAAATAARPPARPSADDSSSRRRPTRAASGSGVAGTVPPPAPAAPVGPPTLRVVPASDPSEPAVRDDARPAAPDEAVSPAGDQVAAPAKRPARGRVSVPGWADVLLSTAPARRADEAAD